MMTSARRILRRQGMPPQEIRAVLVADDPVIVRRLLELHRERLEEWLEAQRRLVSDIEQSLAREFRHDPSALGGYGALHR
jgi:DNA-binding transcriptional MerR regulator